MPETFNTEAVLKDILDVLRKHAIPVQTVALDISMLDADFDATIPQLQTYKAGNFYRPIRIDDVPMLLRAKRRYPFDEIVNWLEQHVLPTMREFAAQIQQTFAAQFCFDTTRTTGDIHTLHRQSYTILLECRLAGESDDNYNMLHVCVNLQQHDATSYPIIDAHVAWLVDLESDGSWGLDIVKREYVHNQEALPHMLDRLPDALPRLFEAFEAEIQKRIQNEKYIPTDEKC